MARWGITGHLAADVADLPLREDRITAHLRGAAVTLDAGGLAPTVAAIRAAGMLSTALAAELDRTADAIGERPQPHLAATLAAPTAGERLARHAEQAHGQPHQPPAPGR